jgi:hypothetical protein
MYLLDRPEAGVMTIQVDLTAGHVNRAAAALFPKRR